MAFLIELLANSVTLSNPFGPGATANPPADPLKFSISRLMILPPSPEPLTCWRLIPFSSANFLARGEAINLPLWFSFATIGDWATANSGLGVCFCSATAAATSSALGSSAWLTETVLLAIAAFTASGSVPSFPMAAKTESTAADCPSSRPI